jgi:hypothetical protein
MQGLQSATIFTIPSGQLQGQMIAGDGSSFGIMAAQGMSPMKQVCLLHAKHCRSSFQFKYSQTPQFR